MARNLNDVIAALSPKRRAKVEQRAGELVARFPKRPPVLLDHIAHKPAAKKRPATTRFSTRHKVAA